MPTTTITTIATITTIFFITTTTTTTTITTSTTTAAAAVVTGSTGATIAAVTFFVIATFAFHFAVAFTVNAKRTIMFYDCCIANAPTTPAVTATTTSVRPQTVWYKPYASSPDSTVKG